MPLRNVSTVREAEDFLCSGALFRVGGSYIRPGEIVSARALGRDEYAFTMSDGEIVVSRAQSPGDTGDLLFRALEVVERAGTRYLGPPGTAPETLALYGPGDADALFVGGDPIPLLHGTDALGLTSDHSSSGYSSAIDAYGRRALIAEDSNSRLVVAPPSAELPPEFTLAVAMAGSPSTSNKFVINLGGDTDTLGGRPTVRMSTAYGLTTRVGGDQYVEVAAPDDVMGQLFVVLLGYRAGTLVTTAFDAQGERLGSVEANGLKPGTVRTQFFNVDPGNLYAVRLDGGPGVTSEASMIATASSILSLVK